MLGTVVNTIAVILGAGIGLFVKKGIPGKNWKFFNERIRFM